jgi:hypothetical protein
MALVILTVLFAHLFLRYVLEPLLLSFLYPLANGRENSCRSNANILKAFTEQNPLRQMTNVKLYSPVHMNSRRQFFHALITTGLETFPLFSHV